jgi:hypothetical protein
MPRTARLSLSREQRVCHRAPGALVEEHEHGGNPRSLFREPVAVSAALALQQATAFHFARVSQHATEWKRMLTALLEELKADR